MCGTTGFIDFKKNSSKEILEKMTDTMFHRGPDGFGLEILEMKNFQLGFGHRRLSIIDLSEHSKQPMEVNGNWITFNGEIYNFKEIRAELEQLGESFHTNGDTEVILKSYAVWGKKCLERFIGMFAFVIYDKKKNQLFCARDRAGVKPFFYYQTDDLFLFGSELKTFHEHPNFKKELNLSAVGAFMQFGNVPSDLCIFENCHKLKAGHTLTFNLDKKTCETKQYWNVYDYYNAPKSKLSFVEAKVETEKIIQSAVDYRMVSDVPVGVFLSGGYDSACVAALLQKERSEKIKTFTIGVPDIGLNEAPYAKDVAKHLGTEHYEFNCTTKEAIELIDELPFNYDEPFADSSAIPTTLVSKMAREHVTVALSADGGDETFAGYNRYDFLSRYQKKLNKIPSFARKGTAYLMDKVSSEKLPVLRDKYNFHNRYEKLKGILRDPSSESIMLSVSQQFTDKQLMELMQESIHFPTTAYISKELKSALQSPLSYMMAIDYQTYLVDDILQKVDRASMTVSLEGREPLLDHRIIEFSAQLPDDFKYRNGEKKYILKEIVHQYIPKEMMDRPKMGFAIPIANWMQNELKNHVEEYISESKIKEQGLFNWTAVSNLKSRFFSGRKELDSKLWYLLMFQMWYERWMK
jgi:asparagine synthase (glutamine-hydrolysing)|tara:strand:- start:3459 stop:5363 length:1905 start_codon:yes stop_codon:yes gene_type:complete